MADEIENDKGTPPGENLEVEEGIDELKKRLAESEQKRLDAEADARASRELANKNATVVNSALDAVDQSHLSVIVGAIEKLKGDQERFKQDYATAMSNGDFNAAAEANQSMSTAAAQLLQLENGKIAIETKPKREAVERARASEDPVERLATSLTQASAEWVRRHPQFARDPALYKKMLAAHYDAIAEDKVPDTPDYFTHVETKLGLRKVPVTDIDTDDTGSSAAEPLSAAAAPAKRDVAPPAAPASRGSGGRNGTSRLSPQQKEAAAISGISEEEYAKNLEAERARSKAQVH